MRGLRFIHHRKSDKGADIDLKSIHYLPNPLTSITPLIRMSYCILDVIPNMQGHAAAGRLETLGSMKKLTWRQSCS